MKMETKQRQVIIFGNFGKALTIIPENILNLLGACDHVGL